MAKQIELIPNGIGGIDLLTERDGGNLVRILTGNQSIAFWKNMSKVSNEALKMLEENQKAKIYKGK